MNRNEKQELISELNTVFSENEFVLVAHYKGVTVAQVDALRDKIREAGAGYRVTKNRLTRLALKGTKFECLSELLQGPTAIAYSNDIVSTTKACAEFAKVCQSFTILGGSLDGKLMSKEEINVYATLPSFDELRAKIISVIQTPATRIACVLDQYAKKEG